MCVCVCVCVCVCLSVCMCVCFHRVSARYKSKVKVSSDISYKNYQSIISKYIHTYMHFKKSVTNITKLYIILVKNKIIFDDKYTIKSDLTESNKMFKRI